MIERSKALHQRLRAAASEARVDFNINDEAAGRMRQEMASAAATRRADEARRIAKSNADMQRRLRSMRSKTDHRTHSAAGSSASPFLKSSSRASGGSQCASSGGSKSSTPRRTPRSARADSRPKGGPLGGTGSTAGGRTPAAAAQRRPANLMARYNDYDDRPKPPTSNQPTTAGATIAACEAAEVQNLRQLFVRNRNVTSTPIGEQNNAQRYFAASEFKAEPRGGFSRKASVPNWDPRPLRTVPYECRGLRPVVSKEPWQTKSVKEAWARRDAAQLNEAKPDPANKPINLEQLPDEEAETGLDALCGGYNYATATFLRLDDGSHDSVAQLYNRRRREDALKAHATRRDGWDPTPWRYVPPALRGLKPVTDEPWAADEILFDRFVEM